MATQERPLLERPAAARRMQLRYGFNEIDAWWRLSLGEHAEKFRHHHRLMGTQVVRIFVFDKPVPDPIARWDLFAGYAQAVLDLGAVPMVTFAKYHPPHDDARNLRTYVARCTDIVWGCLEQWGAAAASWHWCVWNEPNNVPVGGGLSYPQYRRIYEAVATAIHPLLEPHLHGRKARIGGPALDGFQPYWLDWVARLVNEVDDRLVGFVSWHHYGDWRPVVSSASLGIDLNGSPDAPMGEVYERLLMAQTPEYEARAKAVARLLVGRDILNVCGEFNAVVHHDHVYAGGLNQNAFGAAYYISALIHLLRGGADLEMRWTATSNDDAYGLLEVNGEPMPAGLAKQLFAQNVRFDDQVSFPPYRPEIPDIDAVVAHGEKGRCSGVFVHTARGARKLNIAGWDDGLLASTEVFRIDMSTGGRVIREPFNGTLHFEGYGVAVVTNAPADTVVD